MPQNVNYAIKSGYVQILLSSIDPASSVAGDERESGRACQAH